MWRWCAHVRGRCTMCGDFVAGLWTYFEKPGKYTHTVCSKCAEEA
jgi:hypothetical protein